MHALHGNPSFCVKSEYGSFAGLFQVPLSQRFVFLSVAVLCEPASSTVHYQPDGVIDRNTCRVEESDITRVVETAGRFDLFTRIRSCLDWPERKQHVVINNRALF